MKVHIRLSFSPYIMSFCTLYIGQVFNKSVSKLYFSSFSPNTSCTYLYAFFFLMTYTYTICKYFLYIYFLYDFFSLKVFF